MGHVLVVNTEVNRLFMAKVALEMILASLLLLASCNGRGVTENEGLTALAIDKIVIRLQGKSSIKDDDLLKIITEKELIKEITSFVEIQAQQRDKWETEGERGGLSPQPFLYLRFYSGSQYQFSFGIGPDFFSLTSVTTPYRTCQLEGVDKSEFLKLIQITNEEYEKLYQDRFTPGPWKRAQ